MSQQATPSTSFFDQFAVQFSQSLSKYKRHTDVPDSFDSPDSSDSESSSGDDSSSTGDEIPEWTSNGQAKIWKAEVGKKLQQELEVAVMINAKDEEIQLHREIGVFRNFIKMEYFEAMEHYFETTADYIREEITKAANEIPELDCIGDVDSFPPSRPSSALSTNLASVMGSSPPKKLKVLPKAERLEKAMTAVRNGATFQSAANAYGVNRQTLRNRISGKRSMAEYHESSQLLTSAEEAALLRFVDQFVALGFPPRLSMLEEKAVLLLREKGDDRTPGVNWSKKFLARHSEYDSKFPRHLDQERQWNSDVEVFQNWFALYDRTCLKYSIATGDQYNMDEKGYMMGVAGAGRKVIVRRSQKTIFSVHSGDRTWVTTFEFISSRGRVFRPLIIFRGKKIQKAWTDEWSYPTYGVSQNGWTDVDAGLAWLKEVFHPDTVNLGGRRLLIIDGHTSHVSVEFIEYCWAVDIVPLCLPPHTTHFFQPLDVGCFGPLTKAYKRQLEERSRTGVVQITKLDFLTCFRKARDEVITANNIMSAWARTGLYSFDPIHVLQKLPNFLHRPMTPPPSNQMSGLSRTPTNPEEMISILKSLNPYSPNHKSKLNKVLKAMNTLQADLLIFRESTRSLFRANMNRETQSKKKTTGYIPAYGRVLTEAEATRHRENEAKKLEIASQKKELAETKKLAVATKKMDAEAARQIKRVERAEKRRVRDEMKAIKATEVMERKRKREEVKNQKELERLNRPKRVYRKRLHQPSLEENTLSATEDTPSNLMDPTLQIEDFQARSPTPSMGGYIYPRSEHIDG